MTEYKDKFIAFVDILGFSDLVEESEEPKEGAPTLADLLDLTRKLGRPNASVVWYPALSLSKGLDFRITQISDCVVVSTEVSPAGIINLLTHCSIVSLELLIMGYCCRGSVTRGKIYHTDNQFIGSGYIKAVKAEKKVSIFQVHNNDNGTPFIEIDPSVCTYIMKEQSNECIRQMFRRITESDGNNTAISPFPAFKHTSTYRIDENFDAIKCKQEIQISKEWRLKRMVPFEKMEDNLKLKRQRGEMKSDELEKALAKIAHYKRKIAEIVDSHDDQMKFIEQLSNTTLPI